MSNEFKPLTYLAAPYAHPDRTVRQRRFESANRAAALLMSKGQYIFSPISHTHPICEAGSLPSGWDYWQGYDQTMLSCCEKLVVLKEEGWEESVGVRGELEMAAELGLVIEYMEPLPDPKVLVWDAKTPVGADYFTHQLTICNTLNAASGRIFAWSRGNSTGNILYMGKAVARLVEALPSFKATQGTLRAGWLGPIECFRSDCLPPNEARMSSSRSDGGRFWEVCIKVENVDEEVARGNSLTVKESDYE